MSDESSERKPFEKLIYVHGTFAASEEDEGEAWWQVGSEFRTRLLDLLPASVASDNECCTFHWSGLNSEASRMEAGKSLYGKFLELEDAGIPYHVISHSHGGTVVWLALKASAAESSKNRAGLNHLRSWITVGTPFLSIKSIQTGELFTFFLKVALVTGLLTTCLWYLVMSSIAIAALISHSGDDFLGIRQRMIIWASFFPFAFVLTGLLASGLLAPLIEQWLIRKESRAALRALALYSRRWLGLWSTDDEAINGLKMTFSMGGRLIPRHSFRTPVFHSDRYKWALFPILLLWSKFHDMLAPLGDRFIWNTLVGRLHGNDRPGATFTGISTGPSDFLSQCLPLPEGTNKKLRSSANEHVAKVLPEFRAMIGIAAATGGFPYFVSSAGTRAFGKELVHTSYFECGDIQEIIALHIGSIIDANNDHGSFDQGLRDWLKVFYLQRNDFILDWAATQKTIGKESLTDLLT